MKTIRFILIMLMAFGLVSPAAAQSATPPAAGSYIASLSGKLVNRTAGGTVPAKLDLVLHAWDPQDNSEKLMVDGQSQPDGTFQFKEVPFETGLIYGVMATYNGVSYFSQPVPANGQALTDLEVPIYETTAEASQLQIAQVHVLFFASHAGLEVAEVYSLSNLGTRTIQGAVKLTNSQVATIKLPLPAAATNVSFPDNADRFVRTADGFADTAPLIPGEKAGQIIVNYILPYEPGLTYSYSAQWPTGGINFLLDDSSGLTVNGDGLTDTGVQTMGDGSKFKLLEHDALKPGEKVALTLSGDLKLKAPPGEPQSANANSALTGAQTPENSSLPIALGGLFLGLMLVVFGLWWFRRPAPVQVTAETSDESLYKDLLTQIALLDDAHERGEVDEVIYQARRTELFQQARALIKPNETA